MAFDEHDVALLAARIRPHFPPALRPETPLDEIFEWLELDWPVPTKSLDAVEWIMAVEEELGKAFILPDEIADCTNRATFGELVAVVARRKKRAE
jgi:hypothetical protein